MRDVFRGFKAWLISNFAAVIMYQISFYTTPSYKSYTNILRLALGNPTSKIENEILEDAMIMI